MFLQFAVHFQRHVFFGAGGSLRHAWPEAGQADYPSGLSIDCCRAMRLLDHHDRHGGRCRLPRDLQRLRKLLPWHVRVPLNQPFDVCSPPINRLRRRSRYGGQNTWSKIYDVEPLAGIDDPEQQKLVLGAEICKWGEMTDGSIFDAKIWPRLAAAAETFWSPRDANRCYST